MTVQPRCDGCAHWDAKEARTDFAMDNIGLCTRAHALWTRSEWTESGPYRRVLTAEAAGDMMFVQDGSDYEAILLTKAEFYCAHHERKAT